MRNDDLKRFYPQGGDPDNANDFVRYNDEGGIDGVATDADIQRIDEALTTKADKSVLDGILDGTTTVPQAEDAVHAQNADFASQIETDREIEDAEEACPPVVFGTVGGSAEVQSGLMPFTELRGHTIKWNQLVQNGNFESLVGWSEPTYGTMSISDGKASYTLTTVGDEYQNRIATASTKFVTDHKYLVCCTVTPPANKSYTIRAVAHGNEHYIFTTAIIGTVSSRAFIGVIVTPAYSESTQLRFTMGSVSKAVDDVIVFENCQCFDLTDIYGAGNEPSTVAEFVRDFPMPYYAYNAGTPISSKSSSVDFVKRNQWDEEWESGQYDTTTGAKATSSTKIRSKNPIRVLPNTAYYFVVPNTIVVGNVNVCYYDGSNNFISFTSGTTNPKTTPANASYMTFYLDADYGTTYNHDICIYINWETPGLPYVAYSKQTIALPNIELRSAGSVYDVLYQQGGGKRRIGVVDLSTLVFSYDSTRKVFYASKPSDMKGVSTNNQVINGLCNKYTVTSLNEASYNLGDADLSLGVGYVTSYNQIAIRDDSLPTNTTTISGTLYYELATETDITLEENPGWTEYAEIDNFGTVKFNQDPAQDIPVPQAYFVRYTVNLVEFLDSLYVEAGGDPSEIAMKSDIDIPANPTTDGTYTLKVVVSGGVATRSWVADE